MQANNNDKVLKEFGSNVQLALDASIMQFMEDIATNIMDDIKDMEDLPTKLSILKIVMAVAFTKMES